jgi:anti-sigma B factor antagonist
MEFITKKINNIIIIELGGNIMGGPESAKVNQDIYTFIEKGERKFVIDLSKVKVMNSSGLGILIASLTSIKNANGTLKIASANDKIKNLLLVTKLHTIFNQYPDLDSAVKSFDE